MQFRRFIAALGTHARLPNPEDALGASSAFFRTLAERLQSRDAWSLARDLPAELRSFLLSPPRSHGEIFSKDEFFFRMSKREGVPREDAERHARVIGSLLGAHLPPQAVTRWRAAMPEALRDLLEPYDEPMSPEGRIPFR